MPRFLRRSKALGETGSRDERRRQYRTTDAIEDIRVAMALSEQTPMQGELVDLSASGAAVLMRHAATEDLAKLVVGAEISLSIEVPGLDPISGVSAVVRNARETDDGHIFGVEIIDWQTLHNQLPTRVFSAFNRRRHYRLEFPEESAPEVEVQLVPDGAPSAARLGNVSVSGCLLLFEPGYTPALESSLRIAFELPGTDHRYSFRGTVRSASESQGKARCGFEFDASQTENFIVQEQQLSQFIVKRQQESRALK